MRWLHAPCRTGRAQDEHALTRSELRPPFQGRPDCYASLSHGGRHRVRNRNRHWKCPRAGDDRELSDAAALFRERGTALEAHSSAGFQIVGLDNGPDPFETGDVGKPRRAHPMTTRGEIQIDRVERCCGDPYQ